jgi:hypothetical protein
MTLPQRFKFEPVRWKESNEREFQVHPPLRPFPVVGYGYGILPELEGEAYGVGRRCAPCRS